MAPKRTSSLDEYRNRRRFDQTSEPAGEPAKAGGAPGGAARFVIQEHSARRLHWDLRLERDGALASWALPRGLPTDPKQNRLAVRTEDHPIEYLTFQGTIPEGQYGAGEMRIVDSGSYEAEKWDDEKITIHLAGASITGKYSIFRTRGDDWMVHRYEQIPGFAAIPERIDPMLATLARDVPRDEDEYGFEIKWDGVRTIAYSEGGTLKLRSRTGRDVTGTYPEIKAIGRAIGMAGTILDGEIVVLDEAGRSDFQRLQGRMNVTAKRVSEALIRSAPVTYVIFDLLYRDGELLIDLPYAERRRRLEELALEGESWRTPANQIGAGSEFAAAARGLGLEGVIAKRLDCPYRPGKRSRDWLKIKNVRSQEIVIGGWTPGEGRRESSIGALLGGYWAEGGDGDPELRYAGRIGTGFSDELLAKLLAMLEPLRTEASPFAGRQPPRNAIFARPELVGEVEFAEWTRAGTLRAPVFKGLRPDKTAADVTREEPAA